MNNYINDVKKDFDICIRIEEILTLFYYISLIISFALCIKFNPYLCNILIVIHIVYIILDAANDLIFKNYAENERRKTFLSDSYKCNLTEKKIVGYYNNEEKNGIKKLGINCFESVLFSKNNIKLMLLQQSTEVFVGLVIWLFIILMAKDENVALCVTQCIFSSEILVNYFKLLYYNNKVNVIYNNFYTLFVVNQYTKKNEVLLLENVFEYECLKSFAHILLSENNFEKNNENWSNDWNQILLKINQQK